MYFWSGVGWQGWSPKASYLLVAYVLKWIWLSNYGVFPCPNAVTVVFYVVSYFLCIQFNLHFFTTLQYHQFAVDQLFLHLLFCLIQLLQDLRNYAHADSDVCLFFPHRHIILLLTVEYSSISAVHYKVVIVTLKILKTGIARSRILSNCFGTKYDLGGRSINPQICENKAPKKMYRTINY